MLYKEFAELWRAVYSKFPHLKCKYYAEGDTANYWFEFYVDPTEIWIVSPRSLKPENVRKLEMLAGPDGWIIYKMMQVKYEAMAKSDLLNYGTTPDETPTKIAS